MRAEREKRAVILASEGERDAAINQAEGRKTTGDQSVGGKKQQQINEAEGGASAIPAIAARPRKASGKWPNPLRSRGVRSDPVAGRGTIHQQIR